MCTMVNERVGATHTVSHSQAVTQQMTTSWNRDTRIKKSIFAVKALQLHLEQLASLLRCMHESCKYPHVQLDDGKCQGHGS